MEAALVLAIALSFLRRRGETALYPALWAGTAAALALSVWAAVAAQGMHWNEELAEGLALLVGAVLVASLAVWMWRAGPHMKEEVERGLAQAAARPGAGRTLGVFVFALGMVFREGMETAIFLSAITLNSQGLQVLFGALIGLALAVGFGVLFVRGALRVNLRPFFTVTTAVLVLLALQMLIGGLHELSEAEVLPSSKAEMALVGPVVKNELLLFSFTLAVVVAWLLLTRSAPPPAAAEEGPEARLRRAALARERGRRAWTGAVGLATLALLATAFVQQSRVPPQPPAQALVPERGEISFPTAPLADGAVHFFSAPAGGRTVRFFALQVDGKVQACFDACEICGDLGYFEQGRELVCRNCVSPIVRGSLGRSGGCNPIPLAVQVESGTVRAKIADFEAALPLLSGHH